MPPMGVRESCMVLTAPQEVPVVATVEEVGAGQAEADFLPFHVDALHAEFGHQRIAARLGPLQDAEGSDQQEEHDRQERPPLAGVARP